MAKTESKLLPCPFCGGKADTGFEDFHAGGHVKCTECGVVGPVWSNDTDEATAAWNLRAANSDGGVEPVGEGWEKHNDAEKRALQADAGIAHLPTDMTYEARMAVSGQGPRAYEWSDKKHRLVYDLCREIERIAAHPQAKALDGIAVKALEWANWGPGRYTSDTMGVSYSIRSGGAPADGAFDLEINGYTAKKGGFETLVEAQAAAQADYDQRIRSAIK